MLIRSFIPNKMGSKIDLGFNSLMRIICMKKVLMVGDSLKNF